MKPYQQVPINDCQEPLVPLPLESFAVPQPHPYVAVGAPYGDRSPYYLREGVLKRLIRAQTLLQQQHPGWRFQVFDAYRPPAVQAYMVNYAFEELARSQGFDPTELSEQDRASLMAQVYQFWAMPSLDPRTPSPHSTGAAVDLTLISDAGTVVDMGSSIDEISARAHPDYYALYANPTTPDYNPNLATFHYHRNLLREVMVMVDFCPHPNEWWHFSFGDQMWAWLANKATVESPVVARYGAVE